MGRIMGLFVCVCVCVSRPSPKSQFQTNAVYETQGENNGPFQILGRIGGLRDLRCGGVRAVWPRFE